MVNLLRVIDNPHDTIALVGVLRSPLGGMADRDLLALQQIEGLDYQQRERLVCLEPSTGRNGEAAL